MKEKRYYYKGKLVKRDTTGFQFRFGLLRNEKPKADFYTFAEDRETLEMIKDQEIGRQLRHQKDRYDQLARVLRGEPSNWCNWSEDFIRASIRYTEEQMEEIRNWQIVELDQPKER